MVSACRVPASPWVRSGTPLVLLLMIAIWWLPLMGAGVVRYVTGLRIGVSLIVAVGVGILLGAVWWAARPRGSGARLDATTKLLQAGGWLACILMVAWAFSLLYSPDMGALSTYYGPDGGTHMAIRRAFVDSDPKVYAGFVSLYAATHLLDRMFSLAPPGSLALAFYSAVAVVVVVPIVSMMALLQDQRRDRGPRWMGLAAFLVAWYWCLKTFALPLLSNMQVDGFYAHFFVFLPFALAWAADVLVKSTPLRILSTGLAVLLCRFTYGLNLGDLLLTCGILWVLEGFGSRRRALPLLAGVGAVAAGIAAYVNLAPVFVRGGYVEVYGFVAVPKIMRAAVVALAVYGIVDGSQGLRPITWMAAPVRMGLLRIVRLPLLLAGVSLVAYEQLSKIPQVENYYRLKYPLMPVTFLGAAASIAVGYTVLILMKRLSRPVVLVTGVVAIFVFGSLSVEAGQAFEVWQQEMAERTGPRPHAKLRPLVDREIWKTIEAVLHEKGKAFGGFVSADYPAGHFLNGWMGVDKMWQVFYPPMATPGHCVFWSPARDDRNLHLSLPEGATSLWNPDRSSLEVARAALEADPLKICKAYYAPWTPAARTVCHRCY